MSIYQHLVSISFNCFCWCWNIDAWWPSGAAAKVNLLFLQYSISWAEAERQEQCRKYICAKDFWSSNISQGRFHTRLAGLNEISARKMANKWLCNFSPGGGSARCAREKRQKRKNQSRESSDGGGGGGGGALSRDATQTQLIISPTRERAERINQTHSLGARADDSAFLHTRGGVCLKSRLILFYSRERRESPFGAEREEEEERLVIWATRAHSSSGAKEQL